MSEWFEEYLARNVEFAIPDTLMVPEYGGLNSDPYEYTMAAGISWSRLFTALDVNAISSRKFRREFPQTEPKQRGRIAMACYNSLRGAARRRGGLYNLGSLADRGTWDEAPKEWLRTTESRDYTRSVEDRDGNRLRASDDAAESQDDDEESSR